MSHKTFMTIFYSDKSTVVLTENGENCITHIESNIDLYLYWGSNRMVGFKSKAAATLQSKQLYCLTLVVVECHE